MAEEHKTEVHVHNTSMDANAHLWRVIATFLLVMGCVSFFWGLAEWGMLEMAATAATATLAMLFQLLVRNGVIVLPESKSEDARIEEGKSAVKAILGMIQAYLDRSSLLRLTLIAILYGGAFVLVRTLIAWGLGVFANIWIAMAVGAVIASIICFPTLFAGVFRAMKNKKGNNAKVVSE